MVLEKAHEVEQAALVMVQTPTKIRILHRLHINHVLVEIYCRSHTFISLDLVSSRQRLVMKRLPVKRADISGNCIWGANLAALTTWPFNPSIRCVSAGNTSARRAPCNHKKEMGTYL